MECAPSFVLFCLSWSGGVPCGLFTPFSSGVPHWQRAIPDSKTHGANMGHTRVLQAPGWPHVGPMNLAILDPIITSIACEVALNLKEMVQMTGTKPHKMQLSTDRVYHPWNAS